MTTQKLTEVARQLRIDIIKMLERAGSGHVGGSLGVTDILIALYFGGVLKYNPKVPRSPNRDIFVLSAGHLAPALYVILARAGFFPKSWLSTLRQINSKLQGHVHHLDTPGVEVSTASLGQGVGVSVGFALGYRLDKKPNYVWALASDGENQEGSTWEATMYAAHQKLDNLTWIIDRNCIQISGSTEEVIALEPLVKKYESFGWRVFQVDGHEIPALISAMKLAKAAKGQPTVIIAKTTIGKGVSFMEGKSKYHGLAPTAEEAKLALKELEN